MFERSDELFPSLQETLQHNGAAGWHSRNFSECGNLFTCPDLDRILALLGRMRTSSCDMLMSLQDLQSDKMSAKWNQILSRDPSLAEIFDVGTAYARGFFRFSDFLLGTMSERIPDGTRIRVAVDTLDWLPKGMRKRDIEDGFIRLLSTNDSVPATLEMAVNKREECADSSMAFLGLVDSEAWAFGRLQSMKLADGQTVRDRFLSWQARGRPDEPVLTDADQPYLEAEPETVQRYWAAYQEWVARGRAHALG